MSKLLKSDKYRKDIDGLRSIAIISVILFHFGYLPNGYLGVDVFFVISGFLITRIIYDEKLNNQFSIKNFYLRRTRRIIPLVLFTCFIALLIGVFVMIPSNLRNLAQNIIATNLFSNNIFIALSLKDYWHIANESNPLMHTWSLGIEEQYYLIYPFLFLIFKRHFKYILHCLIILAVVSLVLFLSPWFTASEKFYFLPFRFFELSAGGIMAIILNKHLIKVRYPFVAVALLAAVILFNNPILNNTWLVCLTVILTCCIIATSNKSNNLSSFILENKVVVWIGKISFSLYMWHQLFLAYYRYCISPSPSNFELLGVFAITLLASIMSYHLIEKPFRNRTKVSNKLLFKCIIPMLALLFISSAYIYKQAGIIRDIPELDYSTQDVSAHQHDRYNESAYAYNRDYQTIDKIKVFVFGNSHARDWINVLLSSKFKNSIEISYYGNYLLPQNDSAFIKRTKESDILFFCGIDINSIKEYKTDTTNVWCVGVKNFGINNGVFYNYRGDDYYKQRTPIKQDELLKNNRLKEEWGEKYIDIIKYTVDSKNTVPVFTPDNKFISHDCIHFTPSGAEYYARLIENDSTFILNKLLK